MSLSLKNSLVYLLLGGFFLAGFFLRTYRLDSLPSEMHRDEVSIGYNAYSILKTGKDEYGVPWPLVYESFGDYKLPGMLYSVVLSQKFLGLNTLAVRFPTALVASLLIPVSYFLAQELWADKRRSLLVSAMVTFAQWHTFLARTTYEPMMALTLFVTAVTLLLKARKSPLWFIPSFFFFGFSFLTYNVPLLIAPLIVGGVIVIFRKGFMSHPRWLGSFLIALTLLCGGIYVLTSSATGGKLKTTIFAYQKTQNQARLFSEGMMLGGVPFKVTQLFVSPTIFIAQSLVKNYLAAFDPGYLFFDGGSNPWHSLGAIGIGNFNVFTLPLLLLTGYLLSRRKVTLDNGTRFVLFYLLISPLPDAMTIDAPVTNRLLDFHFALLLLASIGGWWLLERSRFSRISRAASLVLIGSMVGYYLLFWSRYVTLHPKTLNSLWYEGISQTAQMTAALRPEVDRIYIDLNHIDAHQLTHLYFAFYSAYDPAAYHRHAEYSLDGQFSTTLSFEPYYFVDVPEKLDFGSGWERFFPEGVETALFVVRLVNEPPHAYAQEVIYDNWHKQPLWQIIKVSKSDLKLGKE
ncbi:MAG TPA: phospholipid carrier-dependent glycosyltransferase [Patescibacteria group bacterium]